MKKLLLSLSLIAIAATGTYAQPKSTAAGAVTPVAINVYPNPASATININYETPVESNVSVTLSDMSGRTVLKADEVVKKGANTLRYPMAGIPVGQYLLRIQTGEDVMTAKVAVVE